MNSHQPLINPNVVQIHPVGGFKLKNVLKIIPEKYIVFQCEDDEPMGEIRINMIQPKEWKESKELLINE